MYSAAVAYRKRHAWEEGKQRGKQSQNQGLAIQGQREAWKILAQRRRTGQIAPLGRRGGRAPKILKTHLRHLRALVRQQPDLTLVELRAASRLRCSLAAIHRALVKLGLTYRKRRSAPASRIAPT